MNKFDDQEGPLESLDSILSNIQRIEDKAIALEAVGLSAAGKVLLVACTGIRLDVDQLKEDLAILGEHAQGDMRRRVA